MGLCSVTARDVVVRVVTLRLLGEEVFEIVELAAQNLVLSTQGCIVQFQLVVLLDDLVIRALQAILVGLLLGSRAFGSFSVFRPLHRSDGVKRTICRIVEVTRVISMRLFVH